ncbi:MAG: hypothetical protein WC205_01005 [Opitutaceae bacterium]|jgi:hypothetical protein
MSEEDVLARIDMLIHEDLLCIERNRDGLPLLGYTLRGLDVAKGYVVERWLGEVRAAVRKGGPVKFSFLMAVSPQRNHETVELLVEQVSESFTTKSVLSCRCNWSVWMKLREGFGFGHMD